MHSMQMISGLMQLLCQFSKPTGQGQINKKDELDRLILKKEAVSVTSTV